MSPKLKGVLDTWARRFNLKAPWVQEQALTTLDLWRQHPTIIEWRPLEWGVLDLGEAYWGAVSEKEQQLTFTATWDPISESQTQAMARIQDEFNRYLKEFMSGLKAKAKQRGWVKPREKRTRSGEDPLLHFKWLVRYQVQGWGYEEISQEFTDQDPLGEAVITTDAIRKAITATAELISLQLRE
ncbi:MAG: hypothetical protein H5T98_08005 [Syntrophomonadaceae bacterium]|nr:hypothetical protein [Syntrophomonadaceae bacterium]